MKYSNADWLEKRNRGLLRYLFFDGVLIMGGPFAVVMQVVGYFFLRDEGQGFGEYFSASRTWITFFFHATLFGLIMGYINWWRNERSFANPNNDAKST
ncbi:MAG: hypothetical protein ABJB40_07135 [Acidobacteriota bacterium]